MSTETIRTIRDGEPRTTTLIFTQLHFLEVRFYQSLLCVVWSRLQYRNLDRPKLVECRFTSTETVGLLGTGAQDVHLDFHTAPEL